MFNFFDGNLYWYTNFLIRNTKSKFFIRRKKKKKRNKRFDLNMIDSQISIPIDIQDDLSYNYDSVLLYMVTFI